MVRRHPHRRVAGPRPSSIASRSVIAPSAVTCPATSPGTSSQIPPASPKVATLALAALTLRALQVPGKSDPAWWSRNRVLVIQVIHAGVESRRLPGYSLTGKLFDILPERTPSGGNTTGRQRSGLIGIQGLDFGVLPLSLH